MNTRPIQPGTYRYTETDGEIVNVVVTTAPDRSLVVRVFNWDKDTFEFIPLADMSGEFELLP